MKVKTASVKTTGWIQLMSGAQSWFTATWFWKVSQYTKNRIYTAFGLPLPQSFVKCFHLVSVFSSINFQLDIDECRGSNNVCDENATIACMPYQRSLSIKRRNFSRNYCPTIAKFCFFKQHYPYMFMQGAAMIYIRFFSEPSC